jgi:hypothetical protein
MYTDLRSQKKDWISSLNKKRFFANYCKRFFISAGRSFGFPCTLFNTCFICRPSDSTVSEDAGIEPRVGSPKDDWSLPRGTILFFVKTYMGQTDDRYFHSYNFSLPSVSQPWKTTPIGQCRVSLDHRSCINSRSWAGGWGVVCARPLQRVNGCW